MDLTAPWSGAIAWLLALHRQVYLDLGVQMRLLAEGAATPIAMLALAFLLGLLHALTPGHGKSVVVTYFLGRAARPIAGIVMGLRIAVVHVAIGIALFFTLRGALSALGVTGHDATQSLRLASHAAVALVGLWLLRQAARQPQPHAAHHGTLGFAIGMLPCPMTLLLLGYAAANATLGVGLMLVAVMAVGIAVTLGGLGLLAILARTGLTHRLGADDVQILGATRPIALASAAIIASLGASFLVIELWSPPPTFPFG